MGEQINNKVFYDWDAIRAEFVSGTMSLNQLCEKHGCAYTTISKWAARENWKELRKKFQEKKAVDIAMKAYRKSQAKEIDHRKEIYDLSALILSQLRDMCQEYSVKELADMKIRPRDITGAIKDLEDVMHIKTDADMEEQKARIENLKRQADQGSRDETVIVRFADGDEDLAK